MTIYRYNICASGINNKLEKLMPTGCNFTTKMYNPPIVDVSIDGSYLNDLNESMFSLGYKPSETPCACGKIIEGTSISSTGVTLTSADTLVILTGSGIECNLPISPDNYEVHQIKDGAGHASSHNIVINGNGKTIDGSASGIISTDWGHLKLIYNSIEWNTI